MIEGKLIDVKRFTENLSVVLAEELIALGEALSGIISRNTPIATSALAKSFFPSISSVQNGQALTIGSPLWGSYGQYVEFGSRPHWAPIQPLITWVREKFLHKAIGIEFKQGEMSKRATPVRRGTKRFKDRELESIAYAIRAKIARAGTRDKRYVRGALDEMGLSYKETHTGTDSFYEVDIATFLKERGVWDKIIARSR